MIKIEIERETRCYVHFRAVKMKKGGNVGESQCGVFVYTDRGPFTYWNDNQLVVGYTCKRSMKVSKRNFSKIVSTVLAYNRAHGYLWADEGRYRCG